MASPFPRANAEVDYPLYAVEFDPDDATRIIIGGGGGAGRSGVSNKISIFEHSSTEELRKAGEVSLPRDEDSVMSLAVGGRKGKQTLVYAGVNSSASDIAKGTNQHLRTFGVDASRGRASSGAKVAEVKVAELSRMALFTNPDASTYQRLVRVSGDLGAAASAFSKEPQLALFDATPGARPQARGVMELAKDAEAIDVLQTSEDGSFLAFCYKYELHLVRFDKQNPNLNPDPQLVFSVPEDDPVRPVFRSIRFLSSTFILALANLPNRNGAVVLAFRLPKPGQEKVRLAATARVNRKMMATSLAVANLTPPTASPAARLGDTQFVVAVGGSDSSISLFTLEHRTGTSIDLLFNLYSLYTLKNVHGEDNISGLSFSQFVTPKANIRQQFLKLASISLQSAIAVHSIPLKKYADKTPRSKNAPPRAARYVVAMQSKPPIGSFRPLFILAVVVVVMAILGQGVMEVLGRGRPILGLQSFMGPSQSPAKDSVLNSYDDDISLPSDLQGDFLQKLGVSKAPLQGEKFVIWEADHRPASDTQSDDNDAENTKKLSVDVHDTEVHGPGKSWETLGKAQQKAWKDKLYEAGAWTESMGETIFYGIIFGELGGVVGHVVE